MTDEIKRLIYISLGAYLISWISLGLGLSLYNSLLVSMTYALSLFLNVIAIFALYRNYLKTKIKLFIVEVIFGVLFIIAQTILYISVL